MAKRVSFLNANWSFILKNMSTIDREKIISLKMFAEKCAKEVSGKPSELPKINWIAIKKKIPPSDKLNAFEKAYESFKIPYPSDNGALAGSEKTYAKWLAEVEKICQNLKDSLKKNSKLLEEHNSIMPYKDMTMEELYLVFPEKNILERPFPWPQDIFKRQILEKLRNKKHLSEEQLHNLELMLKTGKF